MRFMIKVKKTVTENCNKKTKIGYDTSTTVLDADNCTFNDDLLHLLGKIVDDFKLLNDNEELNVTITHDYMGKRKNYTFTLLLAPFMSVDSVLDILNSLYLDTILLASSEKDRKSSYPYFSPMNGVESMLTPNMQISPTSILNAFAALNPLMPNPSIQSQKSYQSKDSNMKDISSDFSKQKETLTEKDIDEFAEQVNTFLDKLRKYIADNNKKSDNK